MDHSTMKKLEITENGVFVTHIHTQNSRPYASVYAPALTQIYQSGGRKALDRRIIEMMANCSLFLSGKDRSISRYRSVRSHVEFQKVQTMYIDHIFNHKEFDIVLANEIIDNLVNMINSSNRKNKKKIA